MEVPDRTGLVRQLEKTLMPREGVNFQLNGIMVGAFVSPVGVLGPPDLPRQEKPCSEETSTEVLLGVMVTGVTPTTTTSWLSNLFILAMRDRVQSFGHKI